jgi:hypothetical protein
MAQCATHQLCHLFVPQSHQTHIRRSSGDGTIQGARGDSAPHAQGVPGAMGGCMGPPQNGYLLPLASDEVRLIEYLSYLVIWALCWDQRRVHFASVQSHREQLSTQLSGPTVLNCRVYVSDASTSQISTERKTWKSGRSTEDTSQQKMSRRCFFSIFVESMHRCHE